MQNMLGDARCEAKFLKRSKNIKRRCKDSKMMQKSDDAKKTTQNILK
jgi:hypothetical protein